MKTKGMEKIRRPRILAVSQLPPPFGGLANNMQMYLSSDLRNYYDISCLNLSAGLMREKDPDKPSIITAFYAISTIFMLMHMIIRRRPDLVYMKAGTKWGFLRDLSMIVICKLLRKRLVCHLHSKSSDTLFLRNRGLRTIFRWVMCLPEKVIVLSDNLRTEFASLISVDKIEVINDIVDTSLFGQCSKKGERKVLSPFKEPIKVLFVGRLSQEKGIWDLLEVIRLIVAVRKMVIFELAGLADTKYEEVKISDYLAKAPFKDRVVLLGTIQGEIKIRTFEEADIFVLPTRNDNMPNTLLEAFAAGLPVVSTKVGQIPEMVEEGVNGFIVEAGDTKRLSEKLIALIECAELRGRMGRINYRKAEERYSIEVGVSKMKNVFENLLGERREAKDETGYSKA